MRTITRRSLLGGGVMAAGGAAAVVVGQDTRGRRWLHRAGLLRGPDTRPPDVAVAVERHTLWSRHLGAETAWAMSSPPHPEAVIVCLHGRGASHRFAFESVAVHRFAAGAGLPWAVVAADGGSSSYWHRRRDGVDAQAMVFDELLPEVERRTGSVPVFLLGWSMGGYGALLAAADRPGRVAAVAASSPAVWRSFGEAAGGAFDDRDDFVRNNLFDRASQLARVPVRLDCGRDDPFVENVRALARLLPTAASSFGDGFHDEATWRSFLPEQLEFLRRARA